MESLKTLNLKLKNQDVTADFLKVKLVADRKVIEETLTRIGVANTHEHILYPSCYLHDRGEDCFLVHFKQLFLLRENHYNNVSKSDITRRNAIAYCLKNWGMIEVDENEIMEKDSFVFVLPHKDKQGWNIIHKFNRNSIQEGNHERTERV